jgi:hypothetical protein
MEVALMPFGSLLAALEGIHDPRRPQGQRYSLSHLLLFSVLAGATSYQKIIAVQRDRLNTAFGACLRRAPAVNAAPSVPGARAGRSRGCLPALCGRVERDGPGDWEAHHRT